MKIYGRYKAGRLTDGFERGKGYRIHAVSEDSNKAFCGTKPGKRSVGWRPFYKEDYLLIDKVNCKICLQRIENLRNEERRR